MSTGVLDRPDTARPRSGRTIATVVVIAVLILAAIAVDNVLKARRDRAPYGADAIGAGVRLEMVSPQQAQAAADRLAGTGRLTVPIAQPGQQQVIGQLTFRTPRTAPHNGQYALFVIDRGPGKPVSQILGTGPAGTDVGQGWDSRYDRIAAKYPWLRMLAQTPAPDGSGFMDPGTALILEPNNPGPITFAALLDPDSPRITDPARQLTVALAFIASNGHVYWATKLAG